MTQASKKAGTERDSRATRAKLIRAVGAILSEKGFTALGVNAVARKAGVKVLRFSVGFGRPLYTWRRNVDGDDIEYVIAAIPFGGYVKMLDEREGEVADADRARAFNNQSVLKRSLIVFAGPAFNFILAVMLYWVVFMIGSTVDRPLVGELDADTLAARSALVARDEIVMVGDEEVHS